MIIRRPQELRRPAAPSHNPPAGALMTKTWTEANVLKLRPAIEKADCKVKHPSLAGLAIRFRNGGVGTFTYYYSIGGRDQTIKIGKVGAMNDERNAIKL